MADEGYSNVDGEMLKPEGSEWQLFVKRPELRLEEFPEIGIQPDLQDWKWWLTIPELVEEVSLTNFKDDDAKAFIFGPPQDILDPEIVIRMFCYCHEFRIYPPDWIIKDLHRRFTNWLIANYEGGNRPLDDFFKLPGKRPDFFRRFKLAQVHAEACKMIQVLRHYFGFKYGDAIEVVSGLVEQKGITYDMLEKEYKAWKKTKDFELWQERNNQRITPELKRKYLTSFPPDTFPSHIQNKYPCLRLMD